MTVTMSSEGDSAKSALPEKNDKSVTDTTDSSQDSHDANAKKVVKETENNADAKGKDDKLKDDKEKPKAAEKGDVKADEENDKDKVKAVDKAEKDEPDKKATNDTNKKDKKKEKVEAKVKDDEEEDDKSEESEKDDSENDSEKDDDKEVPLLDQPLEKSGKRERKNVQRFNEDAKNESKEKDKDKETAKVDFDSSSCSGCGVALGDIPRIDASISRFKNDDLKLLHRLLYNTVGKPALIKKNIKKFNGFEFEDDTDEYNKKVQAVQKFELKQLKIVCEMLDLAKTGAKDDIVGRIMVFLMEPKDSGKPLGGGRPKRTAAVRANNRGYESHDDYSSDERQSARARRDKGKRPNLKDESSSESDEDFQLSDEGSDDTPKANKRKRTSRKKESTDDDDVTDEVSATSDDSEDEPASKRRKNVKANNKPKPKSAPGRRGRKPSPKKNTRNAKKAKDESSEEEEEEEESDQKDNEGSSSEDEPLVKKAKNAQPPTDDEIKAYVKNILEGANLEEITMKTVCQRVYAHYPDFDLAHKKDFIKTTVKSLIST